jgi:hypothetical protein
LEKHVSLPIIREGLDHTSTTRTAILGGGDWSKAQGLVIEILGANSASHSLDGSFFSVSAIDETRRSFMCTRRMTMSSHELVLGNVDATSHGLVFSWSENIPAEETRTSQLRNCALQIQLDGCQPALVYLRVPNDSSPVGFRNLTVFNTQNVIDGLPPTQVAKDLLSIPTPYSFELEIRPSRPLGGGETRSGDVNGIQHSFKVSDNSIYLRVRGIYDSNNRQLSVVAEYVGVDIRLDQVGTWPVRPTFQDKNNPGILKLKSEHLDACARHLREKDIARERASLAKTPEGGEQHKTIKGRIEALEKHSKNLNDLSTALRDVHRTGQIGWTVFLVVGDLKVPVAASD